ncbi:MAG: hypothetical protein ACREJ3_14785 [Polyangiaceae bacterium]
MLILLLRFIKFLAVAGLFAGSIGAFVPRDLRDRRIFAYAIAGPSLGVTWACGFGLVAQEDVPLMQVWILGAFALSIFSLQAVLFAVGKEGRRGPGVAIAILAPLVATVALMVWKP